MTTQERLEMIRLLLGGSPCTSWSIAQTRYRENIPQGHGWELFKNFLIVKEEYEPDYFLYENVDSMPKQIMDCIDYEFTKELLLSDEWELIED